MKCKTGLGQDSHRFGHDPNIERPLILGGLILPDADYLTGNSDADVVLHAITNAVSSITGRPILGAVADEMCQRGIQDSRAYLQVALQDLRKIDYQLQHCAISIECKRPKILPHIPAMRESVAQLLDLQLSDIGITATSGEELTDFGKGLGIQCFVIITVSEINLRDRT